METILGDYIGTPIPYEAPDSKEQQQLYQGAERNSTSCIEKVLRDSSNYVGEPWGVVLVILRGPTEQYWSSPKPYLDPKEPTFLGLLIMIFLYESLKR